MIDVIQKPAYIFQYTILNTIYNRRKASTDSKQTKFLFKMMLY